MVGMERGHVLGVLAVVALVVLAACAVLLPVVSETPLRVAFGLPFVLFTPGYAVVAALFPEAGESLAGDSEESETEASGDEAVSGIDGIERAALSTGLSIVVVLLTGLVLAATPWGIQAVPVVLGVSVVTLVWVAVAVVRRWNLPENERFQVPYHEWASGARAGVLDPDGRGDAALNVLLVITVVLATASVGYALGVPKESEQFSELSLLTEGEDGLVADDYPTALERGASRSLVVGIRNREHDTTEYSLIGKLQRVAVQRPGNDSVNDSTGESVSVSVRDEETVARFDPELDHGETWTRRHEVTPTLTGENLRLTYLLYAGDPPKDPAVENAYREVHLWVDVSAPNGSVATRSSKHFAEPDGPGALPSNKNKR